jgi:mannose-6-phosphate isomerase
VADGPLQGKTIVQLLKDDAEGLMGKFAGRFQRFPLLLKFLDCKEVLSVQVHPSDDQKEYIPKGENGKTEAWVVLETESDGLIYAGLAPGTTAENLKQSVKNHQVADHLHSFEPALGDSILIKAGTVHTLKGVVVFEVQENSDITFRLYDWDRTDDKTGKPRELQVGQALACVDYKQVNVGPVKPIVEDSKAARRERLLQSDYFILWRHRSNTNFKVGASNEPRVLICINGGGSISFNHSNYQVVKGNVILLPAIVGECPFKTSGNIELLEVGIPG